MEKLKFTVENAEILKSDKSSKFAFLKVDFFASGMNRHNLFVSEETLNRTSESILNCPLVWKYDPRLDDVGTHDKDETICGFVPPDSPIESRRLEDGRLMLSTVACIWKRYTGELLSFFKRDKNEKPVSVEIEVDDIGKNADGIKELRDFTYEAITILGTFVTPAIPGAKSEVLSFAELKEEYENESLIIVPEKVKSSIRKSLESISMGRFATSMKIQYANFLMKSEALTDEEIKNLHKKLLEEQSEPFSFSLLGGDESLAWVTSYLKKRELKMTTEIDVKNLTKPEDLEEVVIDSTEETLLMADDYKTEEDKETPSDEEKESPEKEKKEEEKGTEKKFEFPKNFNLGTMAKFFADDENEPEEAEGEEEMCKMAAAECEKGEFADPTVVMGGMYAQMCKMARAMCRMSKDEKVYMSELEALRKFKASVEEEKMAFEVSKTIEELSAKVIIPAEVKEEMLARSKDYSLENLDSWKTYCKAVSFEFALKDTNTKNDVVKIGLSDVNNGKSTGRKSLWS